MKLIEAVNTLRENQTGKFYVIAAAEGAASVENHELAHATFYINDDYRQEMLALNERLPQETRAILTDKFKELGYATTVYEDELQAYLATSDFAYITKRFTLTQEAFEAVHPLYATVFNKYVLGV